MALEVVGVIGNGHAQAKLAGMLENVMGTCGVVNEKTRSLQGANDFFGFESREFPAHAGLRKSDGNLLFYWIFPELDVRRRGQAVLAQAL